ncbi:hypothetical protein PS865_04425 [Pseudomonas fluorescens]|uniref:type III secretion system gatekeeper subunit SctW n=1 Tax=Pseudomonas fluorescens TaxID=294 RepID=UPI0012412964|nr:type III secretion system gatekeeper subunit SctW [Pseudomonas fluorescens]VVP32300.1 hypothetical protein PS865_04425 [Pseudomonas fluorescens]
MSINISSTPGQALSFHREAPTAAQETIEEEGTPAAAVQRFVDNSDEMSAALRSQFRRRTDFGSKFEGMSESFERVLEEDVIPRARHIIAIASEGNHSLEWLLQQARGLFPDDSDLVLVLRELLLRRGMAEATRERLQMMLQKVLEQAPAKRLKAGINVALKARMFGKALKMRAALMRDTYRSFLESEAGAAQSYEDWITLYGYQHRGSVLEFIETALLTDIDALDPSCSREEFGQLLKKLGDLKRLRSADAAFIQRLLRNELIVRHNDREPDWLVFLLGLLQYPDELQQMLMEVFGERLLLVEHRERGQLLQILRLMCLALPAELFFDDEALQRLAQQFTELSDRVYAHETLDCHVELTDRVSS